MIQVGTEVAGRYLLESLMAQGGMGDVYVARDRDSGEAVVVKVLRRTDPRDVERFAGESLALERLDHPAIVRILDTGDHEGIPFLVMERVRGPTLKRALQDGPLARERVARIGRDLAAALAYAHERGIIHRDVKPANVLVDDDGRAHLADFGIARLADVTGLTATGVTMGTAAYLAPEQLRADGVGPPADIYSLGLVLLEALTGEPAFDGTTTETALARLHRDPEIPEDLPEAWCVLLRAMTRREPDERPAATLVGEALVDDEPDPQPLSGTDATLELTPDVEATTAVVSAATAGPHGPGRVAAGATWLRRRTVRSAVALAAVALAGILVLVVGVPDDDPVRPDEPVTEETEDDEVVAEDEGAGDADDEEPADDEVDDPDEEEDAAEGRGRGDDPPGRGHGRGGGR